MFEKFRNLKYSLYILYIWLNNLITIINYFISTGHWCCGLSILLVGFIGCNPTAVLILFSLAMFLNGTTCPGYLCNYFQIAPNHAGKISKMFYNIKHYKQFSIILFYYEGVQEFPYRVPCVSYMRHIKG